MSNTMLLTTLYVQWILILLLSIGVITLFKKHLDIKLGMRHHGLEAGASFPIASVPALSENNRQIAIQQAQPTIFIMTAIGCGACSTLYPCLNRVAERNQNIHFVLMVMGEPREVIELAAKYDLSIPVGVLTESMMESLETTIFPFAYAISTNHKVIAKGTINTEEHLQLLLDSDEFFELGQTA
ncbi:thioredoxin family protein [Paenibacillus brevis]|uniref:Thioredoxin family protein n=1 Tax=Paenibacillus brevis TaxID=2841508 RepID=A0ABS6FPH1_9BACL|nr:thioredoxin family protein [Paenibacillus brevis]MBU5672114.1 thioredoxin family protein [Paenibacillus brevis]